MDEKFLEFWGNVLISAAKGKKNADDISHWVQEGLGGFSELTGMFQKFYGLDGLSERSDEYRTMAKKATREFQSSLKEYLAMIGMISKEDHLTLVEKYEKLKEQCADQKETIRHLRMLLNAKGMNDAHTMENFQGMVKDQGEFFQKMITGFIQGMGSKEKDLTAQKTQAQKTQKDNLKGERTQDGPSENAQSDD